MFWRYFLIKFASPCTALLLEKYESNWESSPSRGENTKSLKPPPCMEFNQNGTAAPLFVTWNPPGKLSVVCSTDFKSCQRKWKREKGFGILRKQEVSKSKRKHIFYNLYDLVYIICTWLQNNTCLYYSKQCIDKQISYLRKVCNPDLILCCSNNSTTTFKS